MGVGTGRRGGGEGQPGGQAAWCGVLPARRGSGAGRGPAQVSGVRRCRPRAGGVEQVGTGGGGRGAGACPKEDARGAGALGMEAVTGRAGTGAVSR